MFRLDHGYHLLSTLDCCIARSRASLAVSMEQLRAEEDTSDEHFGHCDEWIFRASAIRIAETFADQIHPLVSDVVMPGMGGRQVLNAVRQFRPGLRVLFISGYTDDAVLMHGVIEATDSFMQKPFTPLSLARKAREVIDTPVRTASE